MQILMGELQPSQIQAIYFIGQGQEAPDTVTKVDLNDIIRALCHILGWIETASRSNETLLPIEASEQKMKIQEGDIIVQEKIAVDTPEISDNNLSNIDLNKKLSSDESAGNELEAEVARNVNPTLNSEVQNQKAIDPSDFSEKHPVDVNAVSYSSV